MLCARSPLLRRSFRAPVLEEIDCLISDIHLPVMDGVELMRTVHTTLPNVPVILITGDPERLNQLPVGCSHYRCFEKPFDTQALLAASEVIREALRLHVERFRADRRTRQLAFSA